MAKNLWGGRFTERPDKTFVKFNRSFDFDIRLFDADIRASLAHAEAIRDAGVLTNAEFTRIERGLKKLVKEAASSAAFFDDSEAEDVHSFIEGRLVDLIGDTGKKLHTGRSR
ncbi:MAG TPA: lyase family protein, partial [Pyrinomonadaceae bacterium]|nr:lyase family protein [Pyrinomonadaceae bacterium]